MRTIKTIFVIIVLMPIIGYSQKVDYPWFNQYWYDSLNIRLFKTYNVKVDQNDTIISQYSEYSYNPKKNEIDINYFDEFGQSIKNGTREYKFNECGTFFRNNNEGKSKAKVQCIDKPDTTYKYSNTFFTTDSIGRLISRSTDTLYVGNGLYHSTFKTFEYDSSGLLIKTNYVSNNGLDSIPTRAQTIYTYDKQMRLDSMITTSIKGTVRKSNINWIKYDGHIAELYSMELIEESP